MGSDHGKTHCTSISGSGLNTHWSLARVALDSREPRGAVPLGSVRGADWRDAPWVYSPGEYPCDVDALTKRLGRSELVLGDIAETLPEWLAQGHAPVGFLAVDVDYYSSAIAGLKALGSAAPQALLPICESYFDDILCRGMPRFAGEFAAIAEFNKSNSHRQFDRDDSLGEWRPFSERLWLKRMYSFYCLDHPLMQTHRQRQPRGLDLVDAS